MGNLVNINYVMTGEREESVPINGLLFDGPYYLNDNKGNAIVANNIRELEELAGKIGSGNRITINIE